MGHQDPPRDTLLCLHLCCLAEVRSGVKEELKDVPLTLKPGLEALLASTPQF